MDCRRRDPVTAYISDYLCAVEQHSPPPPLARLTPRERVEALELLAGINTAPDFVCEIPPAPADAAARCRAGRTTTAAGRDPAGCYRPVVAASAVEYLDADRLDAALRAAAARTSRPRPVLLYHRVDEGTQPPLWMASFDLARRWIHFADSDTDAEAISARLDVLVSGTADLVTADDWIDDDAQEARLAPDERAELLAKFEADAARADPTLAVATFAERGGFTADTLWMHQHRAETELRALRRHLRLAIEDLTDRRRPEHLEDLLHVLEDSARSCVSPLDDEARTLGLAGAVGADRVEAAVWELSEALQPFQGRLLAVGCDPEPVVADACAHYAERLLGTLDAWLMSASLRRIAARGTIFDGRPLLPDAYREAAADVDSYLDRLHDAAASARLMRRGERLLELLRNAAAGAGCRPVRIQRAAVRLLRSAGRSFGTV